MNVTMEIGLNHEKMPKNVNPFIHFKVEKGIH